MVSMAAWRCELTEGEARAMGVLSTTRVLTRGSSPRARDYAAFLVWRAISGQLCFYGTGYPALLAALLRSEVGNLGIGRIHFALTGYLQRAGFVHMSTAEDPTSTVSDSAVIGQIARILAVGLRCRSDRVGIREMPSAEPANPVLSQITQFEL